MSVKHPHNSEWLQLQQDTWMAITVPRKEFCDSLVLYIKYHGSQNLCSCKQIYTTGSHRSSGHTSQKRHSGLHCHGNKSDAPIDRLTGRKKDAQATSSYTLCKFQTRSYHFLSPSFLFSACGRPNYISGMVKDILSISEHAGTIEIDCLGFWRKER